MNLIWRIYNVFQAMSTFTLTYNFNTKLLQKCNNRIEIAFKKTDLLPFYQHPFLHPFVRTVTVLREDQTISHRKCMQLCYALQKYISVPFNFNLTLKRSGSEGVSFRVIRFLKVAVINLSES